MKTKFALVLGVLVALFSFALPVGAQTPSSANQQAQAKSDTKKTDTLEDANVTPDSYSVDTPLRTGTVVQPDEKDAAKVQPATQDKLAKAFGVVVTTDGLPITFSNAANKAQVYVSTTGHHPTLVTNENGPIKSGDYLAISSLSGTLMKSSAKQSMVFGKALTNFDGKSNIVGSMQLKDKSGKAYKNVGIGAIPIAIEIIKNPEQKSTKANLPQFLQRIGQAIAEKPISPVRIYISTAVIVVSIIISIVLLSTGVRSAIISIGRNPLSKKSIFRALLEVILTTVLVLIIGLFTVYLLLRL
jgi:hypothetical protein